MEASTKPWWTSRTVWTNLLALIGSIVMAAGFDSARWAEIAAIALALVNLWLRLDTKDQITLVQ